MEDCDSSFPFSLLFWHTPKANSTCYYVKCYQACPIIMRPTKVSCAFPKFRCCLKADPCTKAGEEISVIKKWLKYSKTALHLTTVPMFHHVQCLHVMY